MRATSTVLAAVAASIIATMLNPVVASVAAAASAMAAAMVACPLGGSAVVGNIGGIPALAGIAPGSNRWLTQVSPCGIEHRLTYMNNEQVNTGVLPEPAPPCRLYISCNAGIGSQVTPKSWETNTIESLELVKPPMRIVSPLAATEYTLVISDGTFTTIPSTKSESP